jgi:hypothetical protein
MIGLAQIAEAAGIVLVIAIMLGAIGAIAVNEMRRRQQNDGDE